MFLSPCNLNHQTQRDSLLADERVGHDAELLDLSALLLRQVLHGLLGVKARPAGAVAVDLPLVLPGLERALERLVGNRARDFGHRVKSCCFAFEGTADI